MKKIIIILALLPVIFSCGSNDTKTTEDSKNQVGVQNVNGNIPDTTNAINLSNEKKDTVQLKDSLKK